jgi:hypothetical protein
MEETCAAWIALFTELGASGAPSAERLAGLAVDEVRFRDPFNDLRGREPLRRLLEHTRRQVRDPRFEVLDTAWSGRTVYLQWVMTGRVPVLGDWRVEGLSQVCFAEDGRVESHLDYWDAAEQFYGRLPVLGPLLRRIGARAAAH